MPEFIHIGKDKKKFVEKMFDDISKNVVEQLLIRNKELPPTKIVEITNLVGCSAIKKQ